MLSKTITAILAPFLLLRSSVLASPIRRATSDTSEIYYLTNCFNSSDTSIQRAEVDYYANLSLSGDSQTPDKIGIFNSKESIDYEDGTWAVSSPFTFQAVIREDAYTATAGTVIGSATASTFSGNLSCRRLKRIMLYEDSETKCYSDYACTDV